VSVWQSEDACPIISTCFLDLIIIHITLRAIEVARAKQYYKIYYGKSIIDRSLKLPQNERMKKAQ